jgi:hypothetical protein
LGGSDSDGLSCCVGLDGLAGMVSLAARHPLIGAEVR